MKLCVVPLLILACVACATNVTIGDKYVGAPYVSNPLGEGVAPDTDPLIRFDAFDCATFVETALADGNVNKLNKIRYKNGRVGFVNRNHFIETDWIPNNSDLLVDVTERYGETSEYTVTIDRTRWIKLHYNINDTKPVQTVVLKYIPYNKIHKIENTKPMVVLFIKNNRNKKNAFGTDFAVTHMGFLLPNGVLRHASKQENRVVDTDFYKYINTMMENKNNLGIMLMDIKK